MKVAKPPSKKQSYKNFNKKVKKAEQGTILDSFVQRLGLKKKPSLKKLEKLVIKDMYRGINATLNEVKDSKFFTKQLYGLVGRDPRALGTIMTLLTHNLEANAEILEMLDKIKEVQQIRAEIPMVEGIFKEQKKFQSKKKKKK